MTLSLLGCATESTTAPSDVPLTVEDASSDEVSTAVGDTQEGIDDPALPAPTIRYLYAPLTTWTTFPDDLYTVDDPESATGLRVDFGPERAPWRPEVLRAHEALLAALDGFDGWGTTGGILLHFDGPLAPLVSGEASRDSDVLMLVSLGEDGATRIPYEVETTEDHGLVIWPMRPLAQATRHGLVMTRLQGVAADGGSVGPSDALRALLEGTATEAPAQRMLPAYAELLAATGLAPGEVAAAVVFTTQAATARSEAVAADIATRDIGFTEAPVCEAFDDMRRCLGTFEAYNYRDADKINRSEAPTGTYTLPFVAWLPATTDG
ncbi:MAG: hypothetical protein QF464_16450, partial [Myxococcota bacterium]|nr:hypothetical protein [Myxococcota bacterium]